MCHHSYTLRIDPDQSYIHCTSDTLMYSVCTVCMICQQLLSFCSFVEGLAELVVQNSEDIVRLFEQGNRVRKMASVDKNAGGSRYCCKGLLTLMKTIVDEGWRKRVLFNSCWLSSVCCQTTWEYMTVNIIYLSSTLTYINLLITFKFDESTQETE